MTLSLQLKSSFSKTALWVAQHPAVARLALVALPMVVTLAAALFAGSPVYAGPVGGGGTGG